MKDCLNGSFQKKSENWHGWFLMDLYWQGVPQGTACHPEASPLVKATQTSEAWGISRSAPSEDLRDQRMISLLLFLTSSKPQSKQELFWGGVSTLGPLARKGAPIQPLASPVEEPSLLPKTLESCCQFGTGGPIVCPHYQSSDIFDTCQHK